MDILDKLSPPINNEHSLSKAATWTEIAMAMMVVMIMIMVKEQRTPLALPLPYAISLIVFFLILIIQRLRIESKVSMLSGDAPYSAGRFYDQGKMSAIYTLTTFAMGWFFYGLMGTHLDLIVMTIIGVPTLLSVYFVRAPAPALKSPLANKQITNYSAIYSMRFSAVRTVVQKCADALARIS